MISFNKRTSTAALVTSVVFLSVLAAVGCSLPGSTRALPRAQSTPLPAPVAASSDHLLVQRSPTASQPRGTINVTSIDLTAGGPLDWAGELPGVDFTSWGLNFTGTLRNASAATYSNRTEQARLKIAWRESMVWRNVSASASKLVNYTSRIYHTSAELGAEITAVSYNQSNTFVPLPAANYSTTFHGTAAGGGYDYLVVDLYNLFANQHNGTVIMHVNYTYEIIVNSWATEQVATNPLLLPAAQNNVSAAYTTSFQLQGDERLRCRLTVELPEPSHAFNVSVEGKAVAAPTFTLLAAANYTALGNNTYSIFTDSKYSLKFSYLANFTVEFKHTITPFVKWGEDRLYYGRSTRRRDYYLGITAGPETLFVGSLVFNTTLEYERVTDELDAFPREVITSSVNQSGVPYLLTQVTFGAIKLGEVDRVSVEYQSVSFLSVVIADAERFPLRAVEVSLFIDGARYGAKVSSVDPRPLPDLETNTQGQVFFYNVPRGGNYTVAVTDIFGRVTGGFEVNTESALNFVVTPAPHFPTWILIWSGICAAVLLGGYSIYRKNVRQAQKQKH